MADHVYSPSAMHMGDCNVCGHTERDHLPVRETYGLHPKSDKNSDPLEPAVTNDHRAKGCENPLNRGVQVTVGNLQGKELSE